jgi:Domain of unknown function (DUF222)
MSESSIVAARRVVMDSMAALRALELTGDADSRIDGLKCHRDLRRRCEYVSLALVAELDRDGEFTDRGMRSMHAVSDLLGVSQRDGRRMVAVASGVFPTRSLAGEVLEPRLPATAMALGAFEIDLAHAEVIESVLASDAARRLTVEQWVAAEVLFADWARLYSPEVLARKARDQVELWDQDGAPPGGGWSAGQRAAFGQVASRCRWAGQGPVGLGDVRGGGPGDRSTAQTGSGRGQVSRTAAGGGVRRSYRPR